MRLVLYLVGSASLVLGIVGAFLPVMPTVPFLLVAAWAFARSSPQLRQRILDHPVYGHHVREWQERGAVSRLAKVWAVSAMSVGVALALWLGIAPWIVAVQAGICAAVAVFLVTRPET